MQSFLFIILLTFSLNLRSQELRFEPAKASNKLSHRSVTCLLQDKKGFIWAGTLDGLNRYDGYKFSTIKFNENDKTNSSNRVTFIREDLNACLWINTHEGKIHCYNPKTTKIISIPDSSSNIKVNAQFFQCKDRSVWITTNGLGVYHAKYLEGENKYQIKHIVNAEGQKPVLTSNFVRFVVQDTLKNFWIGTSKGLNKIYIDDLGQYKMERYCTFSEIRLVDTVDFLNASTYGHNIWFGTDKNGIINFNTIDQKFYRPFSHEGSKYEHESVKIMLLQNTILWMATNTSLLLSIDVHSNILQKHYLGNNFNSIRHLSFDNFEQVWITPEKYGIIRYNPSNKQYKQYNLSSVNIPSTLVDDDLFCFEDREKTFWICSQNQGLLRYNRNTDNFSFYLNNPNDPSTLPSNTLSSMIEDEEGLLWVGSGGYGSGLNKIIQLDRAFSFYTPVHKAIYKTENTIRSMVEDSYHNIWIASKGGRVYIYSDKQLIHIFQSESNSTFTSSNVYAMYQDPDGFMWLCTKGSGLLRTQKPLLQYGKKYGQIKFVKFQPQSNVQNSLADDKIYDIVCDKNGNYWIASFGGGLDRLSIANDGGYTYSHFNESNSNLPGNLVRCVSLDKKGNLWIGTTKGLSFLPSEVLENIQLKFENYYTSSELSNSISNNDIMSIKVDSYGNIWLGTNGGGINKLNISKNKIISTEIYSDKNGLNNSLILAMAIDSLGFVWVNTDQGLARLDPEKKIFENFDEKNGLPSVNFSENALLALHSGSIVAGSLDGFYFIEPTKLLQNKYIPKVEITGFLLFNKEVSPGSKQSPLVYDISYTSKIELKHNQSDFAIEFTSVSYKYPENNEYQFKLVGFENEWNYLRGDHRAVYTNVPPGKYTFKVICSNNNGVWNEFDTSIEIKVLAPIWKTWPAYLLYIIIIIGLIVLAYRIIFQIARLRSELTVERRVAESKMSFFTNISHEFRTPLTLIVGPIEELKDREGLAPEIRTQLSLAHRNAKRLLRLINQLLDFRKVQNDKVVLSVQEIDFYMFVEQIYTCYTGLAKQNKIQYHFEKPVGELKIWGDLQKLDIVFFNLLSNSFKYTAENGSVEMKVKLEENKVLIQISDTGIGIPPDKLPRIFEKFYSYNDERVPDIVGTGIGLSLVHEYVNLHHGSISVESKLNEGTNFSIWLPLGKNHFSNENFKTVTEKYQHNTNFPIIELVNDSANLTFENISDKPLLLIVEDDVDMSRYISDILVGKYSLIFARDGKEGLEKAMKNVPDLILTDIMMPRMDGIEFIKCIKSEYNTCHIPIIVLSAKVEIGDQVKGIDTGAEWYIPKPFNHSLLLSYVKTILEQREQIRQKFNNIVELKPEDVVVESKDKVFLEKVIQLIEENMSDDDFNVEKLVTLLQVSRTVFFRKLKSLTGFQPVEFVRLIRLKRAASLIQSKQYTVSEVSFMVGFNDVKYFSQCFKKQFGANPSKFESSTNDAIIP